MDNAACPLLLVWLLRRCAAIVHASDEVRTVQQSVFADPTLVFSTIDWGETSENRHKTRHPAVATTPTAALEDYGITDRDLYFPGTR